jgi:hypothetical protein
MVAPDPVTRRHEPARHPERPPQLTGEHGKPDHAHSTQRLHERISATVGDEPNHLCDVVEHERRLQYVQRLRPERGADRPRSDPAEIDDAAREIEKHSPLLVEITRAGPAVQHRHPQLSLGQLLHRRREPGHLGNAARTGGTGSQA